MIDYLPAQCCYNLGEYPCLKPWDPDEWDERELDRLAAIAEAGRRNRDEGRIVMVQAVFERL